MGNVRIKLIRVTAKLFDKRRRLIAPTNNSLGLLKREGRTNTFSQIRVFTSGWLARQARDRNAPTIEIATEDDLQSDLLQTTHITLNGQVFALTDGDVVPPIDTRLTWVLSPRVVNQKYEIV